MVPYVCGERKWPYPQMRDPDYGDLIEPFCRASRAYHNWAYEQLVCELQQKDLPSMLARSKRIGQHASDYSGAPEPSNLQKGKPQQMGASNAVQGRRGGHDNKVHDKGSPDQSMGGRPSGQYRSSRRPRRLVDCPPHGQSWTGLAPSTFSFRPRCIHSMPCRQMLASILRTILCISNLNTALSLLAPECKVCTKTSKFYSFP